MGDRWHPQFAPDAVAYLQRQDWTDEGDGLRSFVAQVAVTFPDHAIDEPLAAVLLHGERRHIDRWRASDPPPLPMPNRRRPPPIVAADEVVDVQALQSDLARVYVGAAVGQPFVGVVAVADRLGLRLTTPAEQRHRRYIARPADPAP